MQDNTSEGIFFPYLGIGPLATLYPFFKVAGANLAASVFSAHFVVVLLGWLSIAILWHLVFRPGNVLTSLFAGALLFSAPTATALVLDVQLPKALLFPITPGNSLRPVRAAIPYLLAISWYFLLLRHQVAGRRPLLAGLCSGIVLLWSNDFAIPTAGLFSLLYFCVLDAGERRRPGILLSYLVAMLATWAIAMVALTAGHPGALLAYNFRDVAGDQWWYFGPYPDERRVFDITNLGRLFSTENYFPLLVLVLTTVVAAKSRKIEDALVAVIGVTLFAGGVLASVGGHIGGYFAGFFCWGLVTFALLTARSIITRTNRYAAVQTLHRTALPLAVLGSVLLLAMLYAEWRNYRDDVEQARNDPTRIFVPELGGYLGKDWADYVTLIRDSNGVVIEEYWGIWSSMRREFPPWPVDSVIHALGTTRQVASDTLQSADIVVTTRQSISERLQPWSLSQNFWFYSPLLADWSPRAMSPNTVVWTRNSSSRSAPPVACMVDKQSLRLETRTPGFYRVTLAYRLTGGGRHLLMARNNISYGASAGGRVSLDPGGQSATFPVYAFGNADEAFDIELRGERPAVLSLAGCTAFAIPFRDPKVLHIPDPRKESRSLHCPPGEGPCNRNPVKH